MKWKQDTGSWTTEKANINAIAYTRKQSHQQQTIYNYFTIKYVERRIHSTEQPSVSANNDN